MTARLYNLARMTTLTTGTGTITLGSAVAGFLSFAGAGVSDGETVTYAIKDGSNSEIGRGVYTATGTTLTRAVLRSTNSNTAISLSGSAQVFITAAAEDLDGTTTYWHAAANNNFIVNAGMVISQENGTSAGTTHGYHPVDQWFYNRVGGTLVGSIQQVTDAPVGYTNSIRLTVSTAQGALSAGDYMTLLQAVEGNRIARLGWGAAGGTDATLGFWVKSSVTGVFGGSVRNFGTTHSYPFSFTVASASAWEWKTIVIPSTTLGSWPTSTAGGMYVAITPATGSAFAGTAGAWAAANILGITGQVNLAATLNATFQITGVVLLPGALTIPSAQAYKLRRHIDDDSRLCKRYWDSVGSVASTTSTLRNVIYFVEKRIDTYALTITVNAGSGASWTPTVYDPRCSAYQNAVNSSEASARIVINARM